jgi:hypothetical protein
MTGHWYDADGIRYDTVPGAKGQPVKPDIRHARKLDLAPGVTTIIRCASSEPLIRWREERVLKVAQANPREIAEEEPDYVARILRTAKEQAEAVMSAGSQIHQLVEDRLLDPECDHPTVVAIRERLKPITGPHPLHNWKSEEPAVSFYGFATRADLWLPPGKQELRWIGGHLIDIKTKDGSCAEQRIYDEHAMQLAATREALGWHGHNVDGIPTVDCGILFVSRDVPGDVKLVMLEEDRIVQGWSMFRALLAFWQTKNQHTPTWATMSTRA